MQVAWILGQGIEIEMLLQQVSVLHTKFVSRAERTSIAHKRDPHFYRPGSGSDAEAPTEYCCADAANAEAAERGGGQTRTGGP